jgi:hypothetical protein
MKDVAAWRGGQVVDQLDVADRADGDVVLDSFAAASDERARDERIYFRSLKASWFHYCRGVELLGKRLSNDGSCCN